MAVGADGVMVEAHPNAAEAMSDGPQALNGAELLTLGRALRQLSPQLSAARPLPSESGALSEELSLEMSSKIEPPAEPQARAMNRAPRSTQ